MHQDLIDYRLGLRSRPMTDEERTRAEAALAAPRTALPEVAGARCVRWDA